MKHNNIGFALCCYASQPYLNFLLHAAECAEAAVNGEQCACDEAGGIAAQELYGAVQLVDVAETFHRSLCQYFLAAVGQ